MSTNQVHHHSQVTSFFGGIYSSGASRCFHVKKEQTPKHAEPCSQSAQQTEEHMMDWKTGSGKETFIEISEMNWNWSEHGGEVRPVNVELAVGIGVLLVGGSYTGYKNHSLLHLAFFGSMPPPANHYEGCIRMVYSLAWRSIIMGSQCQISGSSRRIQPAHHECSAM